MRDPFFSKQFFNCLSLTTLLLLCTVCQPVAQPDSTKSWTQLLLGESSLAQKPVDLGKQKILSASRSLESVEDIPFTVYVVTQEEILNNRYTTLVDVLKHVPGIRVSQPGSAIDGETFLMRGLFGNNYAKILINGFPIRSSVVGGMPIGAQLPVRQAERIEIIFGPAAAAYGADASAGVINIILKETEKPVYTRADLGTGSLGYTDVNVGFGGKIGRGKNILNFNFYGSNTLFNDWKTTYSQNDLYNPQNYSQGAPNFSSNPNYSGSDSLPTIGTLPHLSRLFGFNLQFRSFRVSFERQYRRDHSAIGLNPVAVSYANPLNYVGENTWTSTFSYTKNWKNLGIATSFGVINYEMDSRSSYTYVNNTLGRFLDRYVLDSINNPSEQDSTRNAIYDKYFSRSRFSVANSIDVYLEATLNFRPFPFLDIILGGRYFNSQHYANINYIRRAITEEEINDAYNNSPQDFPFEPVLNGSDDISAYFQAYLKLKKFNILTALRYDQFTFSNVESFNPKVAALYKVWPGLSLRASYSTAFQLPSPFYYANTYILRNGDPNQLTTASDFFNRVGGGLLDLDAEKTVSYEAGLRWNYRSFIYLDAVLFYTKTTNFISYNFLDESVTGSPDTLIVGYTNDENAFARTTGVQFDLRIRNVLKKYDFKADIGLTISRGKEVLPFNQGTLNRVRMQPQLMSQFNISFRPYRRVYLHFNNVLMSDWVKRFIFDAEQPSFNKGYYTLDIIGRFELSRHFQISLRVNNVLNQQYGGLEVTGFIDDLNYNPQSGIRTFLGLSYSLN